MPLPLLINKACEPPHASYGFCNASLPIAERVDDLIGRLTLEEKPFLLVARESPKGNISRLGLPEYDWGGNCIHGVQSRCAADDQGRVGYGVCATSFPDPNALGSTWNRSVWKNMASVIGVELRAMWRAGVGENHESNLPHIGLDCWSPNVGINRDPRWGRNMELPGEDPYLNGQFGAEYSKGMQNAPAAFASSAVLAIPTLKHFDANSLEGHWSPHYDPATDPTDAQCDPAHKVDTSVCNLTRHSIDVSISQYDLASSYLPAFRASVVEGGALGVMCSYNAINGVPSCANEWLLTKKLREDWNFSGYVTGDSGAVRDVMSPHNFTTNSTTTVAATVAAGCDVQSAPWPKDHPWGTDGWYISDIPLAVRSGLLKEAQVDVALRHALGLRFRLGLFDSADAEPLWNVPLSAVHTTESVASSIDATEQALVLLRNPAPRGAAATPTLPFTKGGKLAVLGPLADGPHTKETMIGNYFGQICPGPSKPVPGSSSIPSSTANFDCVETPYEALTEVNAGGTTATAAGCGISTANSTLFAAAVSAASDADVVVLCVGLDGSIEGESRDRHTMVLPAPQLALVDAVLALGKPTAIVLMNGGIVELDDLLAQPLAILSAGYPGVYGAGAIARALFGESNRFGKTSVTQYDKSFAEQFSMLSFDMTASPGRTHRFFTGAPLIPFGFGLSYTTFALAWSGTAALAPPLQLAAGASVSLDVKVANTGKRDGDEVVQCYFAPAAGTLPTSLTANKLRRQLFAFDRLAVAVGATATFSVALTQESLAMHDNDGNSVVYPGTYAITCSNGDATVTKTAQVPPGAPRLLEKF